MKTLEQDAAPGLCIMICSKFEDRPMSTNMREWRENLLNLNTQETKINGAIGQEIKLNQACDGTATCFVLKA